MYAKFHLNRCRFAAATAKCLGGSLFWDSEINHTSDFSMCHVVPIIVSFKWNVLNRVVSPEL